MNKPEYLHRYISYLQKDTRTLGTIGRLKSLIGRGKKNGESKSADSASHKSERKAANRTPNSPKSNSPKSDRPRRSNRSRKRDDRTDDRSEPRSETRREIRRGDSGNARSEDRDRGGDRDRGNGGRRRNRRDDYRDSDSRSSRGRRDDRQRSSSPSSRRQRDNRDRTEDQDHNDWRDVPQGGDSRSLQDREESKQQSSSSSRRQRDDHGRSDDRSERGGDRSDASSGSQSSEGRTPVRGRPVRRRDRELAPETVQPVAAELQGTAEWAGIELEKSIVASITDMGYEQPSDIQEAAIPWMLNDRDVVAQAVTGSGKTAAFGIPMCNIVDPHSRDVQGLVLVPTRELAQQVTRELSLIGHKRGVGVVAVYGGEPIARQIKALERGMAIVVGTPGRLKDLMNRRILDLGYVQMAVLDEADEMLDIGFADDMEYILKRTPSTRQTALFSATIPGFIRGLIRRYLDDPRWIQLVSDIKGLETVDEVDQIFYDVASQDKADGIMEILDDVGDDSQILIFRKMQVGVDRLSRGLAGEGFQAKGIHGGMSQSERNRVMNAFRDGSLKMLVATNLAARGLDIPTISHVINYDMPENVEEYVHRIGRTARMGKRGTAISFIGEWDFELHEQIVAKIGEEKMIHKQFSFY